MQDVGAFYDVYLKIMEVLDCGEDEGTSSGHRLAYALLRLCDKRFHGSVAEEYFEDSDDDKSLYYAYKHALLKKAKNAVGQVKIIYPSNCNRPSGRFFVVHTRHARHSAKPTAAANR